MDLKRLRSKFLGSMVGTGIGDSLGAGREGQVIFSRVEIGNRYTDDTHMMIGVAESLVENKGLNEVHMMKTFIKNWRAEPWRGYGLGPPKIFRWIIQGKPWDEATETVYPGGSFGNGSAMRVSPIGCLCHDDPNELRNMAYRSSRITHAHELGMEGASLQAYSIALAINTESLHLDRVVFLKKLKDFAKIDLYRRKLESVDELLGKEASKFEVIKKLGNGIESFNSVPTAIYSFLSNDTFEDALVYAISLGGDTDTIGAMTGAIAGAFYGYNSIPEKWKVKLENRDYIETLAEKLWEIKTQGN